MLKRIKWRVVGMVFLWLVSLGGLVVLMSFIEIKKSTLKCTDVKVLIPGNNNFVERDEVDRIIMEGGKLIGRNLETINIQQLEDKLRANPYIEFAKIYRDMDGVMKIEVKQREPILRIFNMAGQDFYVDKNGMKIPVSPNFTARVLVANGNIQESYYGKVDTLKTQMAKDLFHTSTYIKADTLWDAQIEQMYVTDKGDIELVPRVGSHRIILGDADSLAVKFKKLLAFYKKAIPRVGWDMYKTISIKYANQIVCEKNIIDSTKKKIVVAALPDSLKQTVKPETTKVKPITTQ